MREGIGQRTIHKLSDFLSNESGRVGAKSALAMGGLIGAAALTQMMFAPEAQAHDNCRFNNDCVTGDNDTCCCHHKKGKTWHKECELIAFCRNVGGHCQHG